MKRRNVVFYLGKLLTRLLRRENSENDPMVRALEQAIEDVERRDADEKAVIAAKTVQVRLIDAE